MPRGLYRVYLYTVIVAMAIFADVSLGIFLFVAFTPYTAQTYLSETTVLLIVTLVVVGIIGGLHYWLIWRDSAQPPEIRASLARAILLNIPEGLAELVAFNLGVLYLELSTQQWFGLPAGVWGVVMAIAALAIVLWAERARLRPAQGKALTVERLRRHGVPLIMLQTVLPAVWYAVFVNVQTQSCVGFLVSCSAPSSSGAVTAAIFAVVVWLVALVVSFRDMRSRMRQVLALIGWVFGVSWLVDAISSHIALLLITASEVNAATTHGPAVPSSAYLYYAQAIAAPLYTVAILVLVVYGVFLLIPVSGSPLNPRTIWLSMAALAAFIFAAPLARGLFQFIQVQLLTITGNYAPIDLTNLSSNSLISYTITEQSLLLTGALAIPLTVLVVIGSRRWDIPSPWRALTLAVLAGSAITVTIAAVRLLYLVLISAMKLETTPQTLDEVWAGSALIVGLLFGVPCLAVALQGRYFSMPRRAPAPVAVPAIAGAAAVGADAAESQMVPSMAVAPGADTAPAPVTAPTFAPWPGVAPIAASPVAPSAASAASAPGAASPGALDDAFAQFKRGEITQEQFIERMRQEGQPQ